jgi:hypothetical protein
MTGSAVCARIEPAPTAKAQTAAPEQIVLKKPSKKASQIEVNELKS